MDKLALLFLLLIGVLSCNAVAQEIGSGDEPVRIPRPRNRSPTRFVETTTRLTDDEDDNLIYMDAGSGDEPIEEVDPGSGGLEPAPLPPNTKCDEEDSLYCWCTYDNGKQVPGTRKVGKPDCRGYGTPPPPHATSPATTTRKPVTKRPVTERPVTEKLVTEKPVTVELVTEEPVRNHKILPEETMIEPEEIMEDLYIDFGGEPSSTSPPPPTKAAKTTTTEAKTTRFSNKIPSVKPGVSDDVEKEEEETNQIGGLGRQIGSDAVQREKMKGLYFTHPGILAAVIGGAVVGLLCAILLIMFIIYRMRKKDEGSYPLDDSKPLKNYAYAKAPSREFYA